MQLFGRAESNEDVPSPLSPDMERWNESWNYDGESAGMGRLPLSVWHSMCPRK